MGTMVRQAREPPVTGVGHGVSQNGRTSPFPDPEDLLCAAS